MSDEHAAVSESRASVSEDRTADCTAVSEDTAAASAVSVPLCSNCEAPLVGPYCAQCGQHAHGSSRSIGVLLHDAWHVLTHVDARLWLTLKTLLFRPGLLTLEYVAGRRARYIPPFQLYLVVSVALFALPSFLEHLAPKDGASGHGLQTANVQPDGSGVVIRNLTREDCAKIDASTQWLARLARDACERRVADQGRSITREFVTAVPRMMFIFLPLMAAVMMLLYLRQHRYYVEHLVYFLHLHSAMFICGIASVLLGFLARMQPEASTYTTVLRLAILCYGVWYVYRSMRRFYGQGRGLTIAKLAAVSIAYSIFLGMTLLSTLVLTVLFG